MLYLVRTGEGLGKRWRPARSCRTAGARRSAGCSRPRRPAGSTRHPRTSRRSGYPRSPKVPSVPKARKVLPVLPVRTAKVPIRRQWRRGMPARRQPSMPHSRTCPATSPQGKSPRRHGSTGESPTGYVGAHVGTGGRHSRSGEGGGGRRRQSGGRWKGAPAGQLSGDGLRAEEPHAQRVPD